MTDAAEGKKDAGARPDGKALTLDVLLKLNERAVSFIRERPVVALFGALALGYLVGKVARSLDR